MTEVELQNPPPLILPRNLIFFAFIWLVATWFQSVGFEPPIYANAATYEPGVREMLLFVMLGLTIAWPLYRLSSPRSHWPVSQVVLDLVVLLSMVQVVLWPLRLVTTWTNPRTAALDATICFWTLIIGAFVALAMTSRNGAVRAATMLLCIVICFLAPITRWIGLTEGSYDNAAYLLSPMFGVSYLAEGGGRITSSSDWTMIALLGIAAVVSWTIVLLMAGRGGR